MITRGKIERSFPNFERAQTDKAVIQITHRIDSYKVRVSFRGIINATA